VTTAQNEGHRRIIAEVCLLAQILGRGLNLKAAQALGLQEQAKLPTCMASDMESNHAPSLFARSNSIASIIVRTFARIGDSQYTVSGYLHKSRRSEMSNDARATKRKEMIPKIAQAFASMGYRRATSAELARRCGVRENILYRLWPDKKAMFTASIDYVYEQAESGWLKVLNRAKRNQDGARLLLEYEAKHHGESGLHRIILAGISETNDPEIRSALRTMYQRFHTFIGKQLAFHRGKGRTVPDIELSAWAIVGLGILADIGGELHIFTKPDRRRLLGEIGGFLLDGFSV
jgi:AcrR family transcriptional regulator